MIRLCYANQTERLLPALANNIAASGATIFHPATVVMPNKNMETYLRFGLASQTGIAANVEFVFLRKYLGDLITDNDPSVRIIDSEELRVIILAILSSGTGLSGADELKRYLVAAGNEPATVDLRRFQLATRLADLFLEYTFSRPGLITKWNNGESALQKTPYAATENWQRALWRQVQKQKSAGAPGVKRLFLMEAWTELATQTGKVKVPAGAFQKTIHVFGISYFARAFHRMLAYIAQHTDVYIYALNPCAEFWEDVETPAEEVRRRFAKRAERVGAENLAELEDPFALESPNDALALRLWGRPGRENIRLLNEESECTFESRFVDPLPPAPLHPRRVDLEQEDAIKSPPPEALSASERVGGASNEDAGGSLLHRMQHDILFREPADKRFVVKLEEPNAKDGGLQSLAPAADPSVTILACPGMRREVECVADEIWRMVDASRSLPQPLRFHEIAVVVNSSQREAYYTHVGSVFDSLHEIPHSIVDRPLASENRIGEALDLLMALPSGNFSRGSLLRLLTHPLLNDSLEAAPGEWEAWCDKLNIIFGADAGDLAKTYLRDEDWVSWDQGLRRLALGIFMGGEPSGYAGPLQLAGAELLVEETAPDRFASAARFIQVARSLLADARFCREADMPLRNWASFFANYVAAYLHGATPDERDVIAKCVQSLQGLEDLEWPEVSLPKLSFTMAHAFAAEVLGGLQGRARYLTDGVVVSSFLPMRAIPFRAIFVMGMGEGAFPAGAPRDPLDLRNARRAAGDVSPRERDKYMFLETLLSTRERLVLSYVSRQEQTGESLEPSTIVRELEAVAAGAGLAPQIVQHPLARYDAAYFESDSGLQTYSSIARREAAAAAWGAELRAVSVSHGLTLSAAETAQMAAFAGVGETLGFPTPPDEVLHADNDAPVSFRSLLSFLRCPLQGSAKLRLGMRESAAEDGSLVEDEVLAPARFEEKRLLETVFRDSGGQAHRFKAVYESAYKLAKLRGAVPAGFFSVSQQAGHQAALAGWRTSLDVLDVASLDGFRSICIGRADEFAEVDERYPAVRLEFETQNAKTAAELFGSAVFIAPGNAGCLLLINEDKASEKDFFTGWWFLMMLAASGAPLPESYFVHALTAAGKPSTRAFHAPTESIAKKYFGELFAEATSEAHDYLLPIEASLDVLKMITKGKSDAGDYFEKVESCLDAGKHSSRFGPIRQFARFAPPAAGSIEDMVTRRFGLFAEMLMEVEEEP